MVATPDVTLLVDGYNIIGVWAPHAFYRDHQEMDAAREALIGALASYSAFQGYQTRLIFDAYRCRASYGSAEVITDALEIIYTEFGETADSHIEIFCAQSRPHLRTGGQRLIVATDDRSQQLTVVGYGAEWMSAQQLIHDIKTTNQQIRHKQRPSKRKASRLLSHSLNPAAKQKLEQWRHGLP